jgi:hypothetical protein
VDDAELEAGGTEPSALRGCTTVGSINRASKYTQQHFSEQRFWHKIEHRFETNSPNKT